MARSSNFAGYVHSSMFVNQLAPGYVSVSLIPYYSASFVLPIRIPTVPGPQELILHFPWILPSLS